jgi:hypothetical protein
MKITPYFDPRYWATRLLVHLLRFIFCDVHWICSAKHKWWTWKIVRLK